MTTLAALIEAEGLPADYAQTVDRVWRPFAADLAEHRRAAGRPILVGINGAQGSGKTTLCHFLAELLLPELGLTAVTLALDDLYLTHAERRQLARDVHPLLVTRGVPGTHDVDLGLALLGKLLAGTEPVALPRFDKSRDDRAPAAEWPVVSPPFDIVLFEGWCVGATPQDEEALAAPVNALEWKEDADGGWRRFVNDALAGPYRRLFAPIDMLVMLAPPDFGSVLANRREQERKLAAKVEAGDHVMDDAALARFVQHYERLTRHMLATLPSRADIVVSLGRDHEVLQVAKAGSSL